MKPTPIPTRSWWLSPPLFWYLAGVAGFVLGCLFLLTGCEDRTANREVWPKVEVDPLKYYHCRLVKWEETGKKKYCGKACWKTEVKRTYACDDGMRETVD